MYIIADVEWAQNELNKISPTQLSAVRVNEDWEIANDFSAYIKPMDQSFYDWDHVAYTGGRPSDFLNAAHCYDVFSSFNRWVGEDTVCWWHRDSAKIHSFINCVVLKAGQPKKPIILGEYMPGFLDGQKCVTGDPYKIAKARMINVPTEKHNSWNDVIAILDLFRAIFFPQSALSLPPTKPTLVLNRRANSELRYQYDVSAGLLHKKECELLPQQGKILGFATLKTPIKEKYTACHCVCEELRLAKREKITDEIKRTQYTFIYARYSKVFHRYDCNLLHDAEHISGAVKYDTVINKGLRPCKVCKPSPNDSYRFELFQQKSAAMKTPQKAKHNLKRSDLVAVVRHDQAQKERFSNADRTDMSTQERADMLTLTQPSFAFFVARGYQNFHTRKCSRLEGLNDIIGFDTFAHAKNAGFTPCKSCKPTSRQDIVASIPIGNKVREEETLDDLRELCDRYGYENALHGSDFEVTTSVGKWKIQTDVRPVTMDHINLAKDPECSIYHKQHRIFLSMLDALIYIHKHDSTIIERGSSETGAEDA